MSMHKQKGLSANQKGLVSLTVTIIIMIVITLIVSSFALIVRREQKRALDRQLSSQAFYAAETGVEDAIEAMSYPVPDPPNPSYRLTDNVTDCTGPDSFFTKTAALQYNPVISENIEYTCVLVDQDVEEWNTASVNPEDGSFVVPVKVRPGGDTIDKIRVSWQEKDSNTNAGNFQQNFPALPQGGMPVPMLRVTVLPGFDPSINGGTLSRADLETGMHTMFLYPQAGAPNTHGNITYVAGGPDHDSQGSFVVGHCNTVHTDTQLPLHCNVDIGGGAMTAIPRHEYFVHIQPLYQSASVSVQALNGSDASLPLIDSQAVVDVTGKAADVLRRIQVRVPIGEGEAVRNLSSILPPGALVSEEAICKKWQLTATTAEDLCVGTPWSGTIIPLSTPPAPIGDASIGNCSDPSDPACASHNGDSTRPLFRWTSRLDNESASDPSTVASCTWDWGDGTPPVNYPGSANECQPGGDARHDYNPNPESQPPPHDTKGWTARIISSNGSDGCWIFRVDLTMNFNNGVASATDTEYLYLPGGQANDTNPAPGVPTAGICVGKYQLYNGT